MSPPHSRLYLAVSNDRGGGTSVACLKAALQAGDVAALLIGAGFDKAPHDGAKGLIAVARTFDVAVIVDGSPELARQLDADGVHVAGNPEDCRQARAVLGDDAIVGVSPGQSRHLAMEFAEAGASYVSFEDDPADPDSLSAWWAHLMEVPCVAHIAARDDAVQAAAAAGIEFICPDESIWQSEQSAAHAVSHFNALIAGASVSG